MKLIEKNKALLKSVLLIAFPIMIQNGFTNFVNLLDNIMVGRLGLSLTVWSMEQGLSFNPSILPSGEVKRGR